MPKIKYKDVRFSAATLATIAQANAIIAEYGRDGFDLTLRQLYYQFVARDLLPNQQKEYSRLGDVIADARLAGLVDWDAITDRTRYLRSLAHWSSPEDIVGACASQYRTDKWAGQPCRPEVWIEKDALIGVVQSACEPLDVPYFSCRGYTSVSEMWAAGRRLRNWALGGQTPVILHFGDHDPSGMDMTRDVDERLSLFMGDQVSIHRLALNFDQIETFRPPPNPAKLTDSRAGAYVAKFGLESWELDSLDPKILAGLVRDALTKLIDKPAWRTAEDEERRARAGLRLVADNYDRAVEAAGE